MQNTLFSRYSFLYTILLLTVFSIYMAFPLTIPHLRFVSTEYGVIENITIVLYFVSISLFILSFLWQRKLELLHHLIFSTFLLAREMDCHKSLTKENVLKIKFYFSPDVDFSVKLFVLAILCIFAAYSVFYLKKYIYLLWKNRSEIYSYTVFSIIFIIFFVRFIETIKTLIRKIYNIEQLSFFNLISQHIEECFEMMIPALISLAIIQFIYTTKKSQVMPK